MCVRHVYPGEPGIQIATCILDGKNPHFAGSPVDFGGGSRLMLPSSKLTWQWKITIFNREYIFNWFIFHCHVSLPEGNHFKSMVSFEGFPPQNYIVDMDEIPIIYMVILMVCFFCLMFGFVTC